MTPTEATATVADQPTVDLAVTADGRYALALSRSREGSALYLEATDGTHVASFDLGPLLRGDIVTARRLDVNDQPSDPTRSGGVAATGVGAGTVPEGALAPLVVEQSAAGLRVAVALECSPDGSRPGRRLLGVLPGPTGDRLAVVVDLDALAAGDLAAAASLDVAAYRALVAQTPEVVTADAATLEDVLAD